MCRCDLHHALKHFQAALSLLCLAGLEAKTIHKTLNMLDFFLLLDVHYLLQGQLLCTNSFKLAVVTGIGFHRLVFNVGDMRTQSVEKIPVMRNQQQDTCVGPQPAFQPDDGRQVQVVGGFIEQQDIRAAHQCLRQVQTHAPATGEFIYRFLDDIGFKTQAV